MSVRDSKDAVVLSALRTSQSLSSLEQKALSGLSGADYERAHAQLMLQKQQETVAFVSKLLKSDTALNMINNLK